MRLPGGRQALPGVATGHSVLAWQLSYVEVLARQHAQPLGDIRPHSHPKARFIASFQSRKNQAVMHWRILTLQPDIERPHRWAHL